MAVVGAAIPIFARRATELGHGQDADVGHAVAEVKMKSRQRVAEFLEARGKLPFHAAFVDMVVPAADFGEGHFQPHAGLNQLSDLLEVSPQRPARVLSAIRRSVILDADFLERRNGAKHFIRGARKHRVGCGSVHGLDRPAESFGVRPAAARQVKRAQVVEGERGRRALERPRHARPKRHSAK